MAQQIVFVTQILALLFVITLLGQCSPVTVSHVVDNVAFMWHGMSCSPSY